MSGSGGRRAVLLLRAASILGGVIAATVVLAWLLGRLASDRTLLTQWLTYIPTPAMIPVALFGIVCALGLWKRWRRRAILLWSIVLVIAIAQLVLRESRRSGGAVASAEAITIVHWNTAAPSSPEQPAHVQRVIDILGDITVLSDAWGLRTSPPLLSSLPEDMITLSVGRFTVLTRLPVIEARPILANDDIDAAILRIDCRHTLGRVLVIYAIDLPSDPGLARWKAAARIRALFDGVTAPAPDIVVGDFNVPRGSASLRRIFPNMHHAWDEGGHGFGATFPRRFPIYHIDHTLLEPGLACAQYDLVDAGVGRHRVQRATIVVSVVDPTNGAAERSRVTPGPAR